MLNEIKQIIVNTILTHTIITDTSSTINPVYVMIGCSVVNRVAILNKRYPDKIENEIRKPTVLK